jgi:hypothetical protein
MKDEQIPVHQLDHAEPIVIHQPQEDMTVLARWLQRGMEQGIQFWLMVGGVIVILVALAVLTSGLAASRTTATQAWGELLQAKTVEDRLEVAKANPDTAVALWAKLLSAQEEYTYGVDDLTAGNRKETVGPRLSKALQLFQEVAKEAPKDSSQTLAALFGVARTLEARNELAEAIEKYRELATKFPNAPEAKQSLALAKALEEPINQQFYKELYTYKPPANPSPGGGLGGPGSMFNGLMPPTGPGAVGRPSLLDLPAPSDLDAPPTTTTPKVTPPAEAPKVEAPKTEMPKVETTPAPPVVPAKPPEPPKAAESPK